MPVILPPSDGGYQNRSPLTEAEEEFRQELKRLRSRQEEQIERLQKNNEANLRAKEADTERTVEKVKEAGEEAATRSKENNNAQYEALKAKTYDRFGRQGNADVEYYRRQLEESQKAMADQDQVNRRQLSAKEEGLEQRISDLQEKHGKELEHAIQEAQNRASEPYDQLVRSRKLEDIEGRHDAAERYAKMSREAALANYGHEKRAQDDIEDAKRSFGYKLNKLEQADQQARSKTGSGNSDKLEKQTLAMRDSQNSQLHELNGQIKKFQDINRDEAKHRAEGRAEAYKDLESSWRQETSLGNESYENQINNLKRHLDEVDTYHARLTQDVIRDKDAYFAKVIHRENKENQASRTDLANNFERNRKQLEDRNTMDRRFSDRSAENRLEEAAVTKDKALRYQAEAFQDTLDNTNRSNRDVVRKLELKNNLQATSTDINDVSPAVEHNIRNNITKAYEKIYEEDNARNKRTIESAQQSYSERMRDALENVQSNQAKLFRQTNHEFQDEKSSLINYLKDTEYQALTARNDQEIVHNREIEKLNKGFATTLEQQRREYEELINSARYDTTVKAAALRQESDFNRNMAQRAFSQKQNELIRDYEKKLADQKTDYIALIGDIKGQTDMTLREMERKQRAALEEQARAYEQRIAQTEVQFQEREKNIAANHADELDRMKRSYALSAKKKG